MAQSASSHGAHVRRSTPALARRLRALAVHALFWLFGTCVASNQGPRDVCQSKHLNASCAGGEVLVMESARYGRMQAGTCVTAAHGYLGCFADVLWYVDARCSGRQLCRVYVADAALHDTQPCHKDFASYLEVDYSCVPVVFSGRCGSQSTRSVTVTKVGYLSPPLTTGSTSPCRWVLSALPGQRMALSLLFFSARRRADEPGSDASRPQTCTQLARLIDSDVDRIVSSCTAHARVTQLYVTRGHKVTVLVMHALPRSKRDSGFLIRFEPVGCAKVAVGRDMHVRTHESHVTVSCNDTEQSWTLTCRGTSWHGETGNCTKDDTALSQRIWNAGTEGFPYGILLLVAIGVALGVFFGGLLLSMVIFYHKNFNFSRRSRRDEPGSYDGQYSPTRCSLHQPAGAGEPPKMAPDGECVAATDEWTSGEPFYCHQGELCARHATYRLSSPNLLVSGDDPAHQHVRLIRTIPRPKQVPAPVIGSPQTYDGGQCDV